MRKSIWVWLIASLFCVEGVAQSSAAKNAWEFGFQYYGLPASDTDGFPLGAMIRVSYDIVPYKKSLIFSIQPYVGGGLFAQKVSQGVTEYEFKYKYNMGAWEVGVAPKLYYPLVEDDLYVYLANEFSFVNMYARTWDNDKAPARRSNNYMDFYYTCKIGVLVKNWKQNAAFWIGYTTLDLAKTVNKNRPREISPYKNERPGICLGASLCW